MAASRVVSLPRKLWVGSYEFTMALVPRDHPMLPADAEGITYFDPLAIYVADNLSLIGTLDTVLHEVTHAVNHAGDVSDGPDEETIAGTHGRIWATLYVDNPRFQRWLTNTVNRIRKERSDA